MTASAQHTTPWKIDFGTDGCGDCDWFVVVDGVMGGLSEAELKRSTNSVTLQGSISLQNNGGFASMRTPYARYDLSPYTEVTIRYRSQVQSFAMTLNNYRRFWQPRFKQTLPATDGEWQTLQLPLNSFVLYRMDQPLNTAPSENALANIIRMGLISNDKRATDFTLEIDYIEFS